MIIKYENGHEVNTDQLPDIDALILEKIEQLRNLCTTANRPFCFFVDARNNLDSLHAVWSYKTSDSSNDPWPGQKSLIHAIHGFWLFQTDGRVGLYPTELVNFDKP